MKECGIVLVFTAEAGGQAQLVIRGWVLLPPADEMRFDRFECVQNSVILLLVYVENYESRGLDLGMSSRRDLNLLTCSENHEVAFILPSWVMSRRGTRDM